MVVKTRLTMARKNIGGSNMGNAEKTGFCGFHNPFPSACSDVTDYCRDTTKVGTMLGVVQWLLFLACLRRGYTSS